MGRHDDYNASGGGFRDDHPEIWDQRAGKTTVGPLNVTRNLHADHHTFAAFPAGIPEGTPFPHFFAQQWGAVSRAVKFDALVLRDGKWGQVEYLKISPFGDHASAKEGRFREVTGSGTVKTTQQLDGSWQAQFTLGANASGVWVFEE